MKVPRCYIIIKHNGKQNFNWNYVCLFFSSYNLSICTNSTSVSLLAGVEEHYIMWDFHSLLKKLNQTTGFIGQHGSEQEAMSQWTSFCKVNRKPSVVPKLSLEREDELTIPERGLLNLPSGINKVGLSTFPSKWVQNTGKAEESIWHVCFWKRYYE